MSVADAQQPILMQGERGEREDLEGTGSFRRRWDDSAQPAPPPQHPVKDIVLPLAVVIGLLANALMIGIAWGRFSTRMEIVEQGYASERQKNADQDGAIQALKDRAHDLERDNKEDQRRFFLLDDYTRGRIDRLPYRPPPPARW